jgi:hypothetical protein
MNNNHRLYQATYQRVYQHLWESFSALEMLCDRIPPAAWHYQPADGGWSIGKILEHVTLTSHYLLIVIRQGCEKGIKRARSQPIEDNESDLDILSGIGHPDAFEWLRPDHMEPGGQKNREEIAITHNQHFVTCLTLLYRIRHGEGSLHKVRMTVQDLGKLDMYQWLYFLGQHAQRHTIEVERVLSEWEALR